MKATTKNGLCVLNTIMSFVACLLLHATIWLNRSNTYVQWIYFDDTVLVFVPSLLALVFSLGSVFEKSHNRKWYIVSAVLSAVPAVVIIIAFAISGRINLDTDTLMLMWRVIPAIILYLAVSVIYFVMAFTKTKEVEKQDETIPYSE